MNIPGPPRVNPGWVRWLWLVMLVWSAGVAWHGRSELMAEYEVIGLERQFTAPAELDWGWILDARTRPLWVEVHLRYAPQEPRGEAPRPTVAAWQTALTGLGVTSKIPKTPWNGAKPRIRFYGDDREPTLLLGLYGTESVLYEPETGVVVYAKLPPAESELELTNAREAPW